MPDTRRVVEVRKGRTQIGRLPVPPGISTDGTQLEKASAIRPSPTLLGLRRLWLLAGTMLLLAACGNTTQEVQRLKLALLDTQHPVHRAMEHMATVLHDLSGGTMLIEIHPNGQLGSERELIELLQSGKPGHDQGLRQPAGRLRTTDAAVQHPLRFSGIRIISGNSCTVRPGASYCWD